MSIDHYLFEDNTRDIVLSALNKTTKKPSKDRALSLLMSLLADHPDPPLYASELVQFLLPTVRITTPKTEMEWLAQVARSKNSNANYSPDSYDYIHVYPDIMYATNGTLLVVTPNRIGQEPGYYCPKTLAKMMDIGNESPNRDMVNDYCKNFFVKGNPWVLNIPVDPDQLPADASFESKPTVDIGKLVSQVAEAEEAYTDKDKITESTVIDNKFLAHHLIKMALAGRPGTLEQVAEAGHAAKFQTVFGEAYLSFITL